MKGKSVKVYTVGSKVSKVYGHGDSGSEEVIARMGPYGTGEFPPLFTTAKAAQDWFLFKHGPDCKVPEAVELEIADFKCWILWAHDLGLSYRHIGSKFYVETYGLSHPIVQVTVLEDPQGDYWGWLATGAATPTMIWPSENLFRVCFPYGPDAEVKAGKGRVVKLRVMKRETETL